MESGRIERRLSAILAADVAGYSRLMEADEEGTHGRLKAHRDEILLPALGAYRGRLVKTTGDGLLAEFQSSLDAVHCAVAIQRAMKERNAALPPESRMEFRIGINVGDNIVDGGDIYGEGVNIAARLEGLADPGGICVASRVRDDVLGKIDAGFEDLGEQLLKNMARPVRLYRLRLGGPGEMPRAAPALPDKPSIAVLPFENMSGDPEQEYFADGIVEEIITALARIRWLFVIARNSSFTYKGRAVDVKQVGRELGVRYVLEGSVRKAAGRVRITGQLIDAATGAHLWADRFDGSLADIFDLQDQVTASVVGAIAPKLELAEIERARRKLPYSLDAYDYHLRGTASAHLFTRDATGEALRLFMKAIDLDPDFAAPYGGAVRCYAQRKVNGWMVDVALETAEAIGLARRAVALGKEDAETLAWGALGLALIARELDDGADFVAQARALNPNLATVVHLSGLIALWRGDPEATLEHEARAMRLSPVDPLIGQMQSAAAWAHFALGHVDDAAAWAERAMRSMPSWFPAYIVAAAAHALAGRLDAARAAAAGLHRLNPAFAVADLGKMFPLRRAEDLARLAEGLEKAGL